jgi:TPR repeat protein
MSAPPADIPQNNAAAAPPEAAPMRSSAKPRAAQPSPRASQSASLPGTEEMSRAARASDAEARAAWLWRALGKGNPQAPVELARMYELGAGVVRSCDQAQVLLRSAAAKGNEQAKLNLQQMRMRGCR